MSLVQMACSDCAAESKKDLGRMTASVASGLRLHYGVKGDLGNFACRTPRLLDLG